MEQEHEVKWKVSLLRTSNCLVRDRVALVLHNDDITELDVVVEALANSLHCSLRRALELTFSAHRFGSVVLEILPRKKARQKKKQLCELGLNVTIEGMTSRD